MQSLDDKILAEISKKNKGYVFVYSDFSSLGSASAIRVAVHRLVKKGVLHRLIPGVFVLPDTSKLLNTTISPDLDKVAHAIARRDSAKITPTSVFALYALGLSTQIPLNLVYLTDGKARKIKVGKSTITFKKASPKKLALKGKISKLVILALSEIGKEHVKTSDLDKIKKALEDEDINHLQHDLQLAPQWIAELITKLINHE